MAGAEALAAAAAVGAEGPTNTAAMEAEAFTRARRLRRGGILAPPAAAAATAGATRTIPHPSSSSSSCSSVASLPLFHWVFRRHPSPSHRSLATKEGAHEAAEAEAIADQCISHRTPSPAAPMRRRPHLRLPTATNNSSSNSKGRARARQWSPAVAAVTSAAAAGGRLRRIRRLRTFYLWPPRRRHNCRRRPFRRLRINNSTAPPHLALASALAPAAVEAAEGAAAAEGSAQCGTTIVTRMIWRAAAGGRPDWGEWAAARGPARAFSTMTNSSSGALRAYTMAVISSMSSSNSSCNARAAVGGAAAAAAAAVVGQASAATIAAVAAPLPPPQQLLLCPARPQRRPRRAAVTSTAIAAGRPTIPTPIIRAAITYTATRFSSTNSSSTFLTLLRRRPLRRLAAAAAATTELRLINIRWRQRAAGAIRWRRAPAPTQPQR